MNTLIGFGETTDGKKITILSGDRYRLDGYRLKRILLTVELQTREDVSELIDFLVMSRPGLDKEK